MRTMERDEVVRGRRGHGHGHGCCGGCGGPRRGRHLRGEEAASTRRRALEERQRDLEEALAEVTSELADLDVERP
jgi:hypothetical protein